MAPDLLPLYRHAKPRTHVPDPASAGAPRCLRSREPVPRPRRGRAAFTGSPHPRDGDRGLSDELRRVNLELPLGEGLIGRVALSGSARRVDNASMEEDLLPAAQAAVSSDGIRGFVCVPIRARHRILGTLSLGRQTEDRFTDEEIALLECVADQIGLAIDNARLYGEINRQLDDLRRAQIEVVRAERLAAVNGLAAGVAHEINNPLTIIMAQLHLLAPGGPGPPAPG